MISKYQIIVTNIKEQISSGQLKTSDKLPSIRQLSQQFSCNKDTVQKALAELRHQNLIYPIHKSGYYVLETPDQTEPLALPESDIANIAYDDFRLCLNETLVGRENYLFNYYHKQEGLEDLLQSVQKLLVASSVYSKQDQLVITSGTQQALYILSQMMFPSSGGTILLEEPTYPRMIELVKTLGLAYQTIPRNWSGINLTALEAIFKSGNITFFYTIPRLHNPLGMSYTVAEKQAIVALAAKYQVYIIEDDYMADFDAKRQAPLHYYDTNHRVIYIKSFSASIFPALRLATVVLPNLLLKAFLSYKQLIDFDTNLILQKALSLYIDNGMFEKNKLALQTHLKHNQAQNQQLLNKARNPFPYQLLNQQVIFQIDKSRFNNLQLAKLEQFDQLDANYLTQNAKQYLRITGQKELKMFLDLL
ncbi:aminotransferase-like domain-containing protein [Streptococcus merionis]|uniref:GntR family aminotransferase n=1 Tax=Streptococcus merionis TaxID=400065 RepID=A0A239SVJ9_9STRE|nr:PLP-dependent aminotransferase family protein [Streptococcus merionis]SNU88613.1 GntR family aminotransferase [Streptococcus merionis]